MVWWLVVFAIATLATHSNTSGDPIKDKITIFRVNFCVVTICYYLLFANISSINPIIWAARFVLVFTCILNVFEVITPGIFPVKMSAQWGRAAGLYGDANQCAQFIASALVIVCLRTTPIVRAAFCLIAAIGVLFTFSREGFLILTLAIILVNFCRPGRKLTVTPAQAAGFVAITIVGLALMPFARDLLDLGVNALKPFLNPDTLARLQGNTTDSSSNERLFVAQLGLQEFMKAPIFGQGPGTTHSWAYQISVHNMFILMMVEHGVVGLLLIGAFIYCLFRMKWPYGVWAGMLFLITTPFTHTYYDLPYYGLIFSTCWAASRFDEELRGGTPLARQALTAKPKARQRVVQESPEATA